MSEVPRPEHSSLSGDDSPNLSIEQAEAASETITARALWFVAPGTVELREEEVPPPGAGEIRVRAIASAISHGTEMLVYRGQVPEDLPLDLPTLRGSFAFPIKYGYASVGRVIDVGPEVPGFAPRDLVFALHPHQTTYIVPVGLAVRLRGGIDPEIGIFTANLETAINVLLDTPLKLGETALVIGQGTVGLLITQLLRRAGAGQIIGIDVLPRRRQASLHMGAHTVLDPGPDLVDRIRALTNGRGADVAIEVSGAGAALQTAIDGVADEGTVVAVSWYGTKPVILELGGHFHRSRVRIVSSQVGRINPSLSPRWDHARRSSLIRDLLNRLPLERLITQRVPFDVAAEAYHLIDERPEDVVQVVLTYGDEEPDPSSSATMV